MEKNIRMIFKINVNDNSEICWISIYIYIKKKNTCTHIQSIYNIQYFDFFFFLFYLTSFSVMRFLWSPKVEMDCAS